MKNKTLWLSPGHQPVCIGFIPDENSWHKTIKRLGHKPRVFPTSSGHCLYLEGKNDNRNAVLVVCKVFNDPKDVLSVLAHEAVHVVQFCHQAMGVEKPDMETEAYFIQSVFCLLCRAYEDSHKVKLTKKPTKKSK